MDEALVVAVRLARGQYGGGDPETILKMRADHVIAIIHYENFCAEYERTYAEINREDR